MGMQVEERGIIRSRPLTPSNSEQQNVPAGALFRVTCTGAGNVVAVLEDGGSLETIAVDVGYSCYPYRVVRVNTTNTTATATYANLDIA